MQSQLQRFMNSILLTGNLPLFSVSNKYQFTAIGTWNLGACQD
jgi:hypothetical protein